MSTISAQTAEHRIEQPAYRPRVARAARVTRAADPAAAARRARWAARALHALERTLAALFLVAGAATLVGTPEIAAAFGRIENTTGLGAWLRVAVGLAELVGGVLLGVRRSVAVGAVLLGLVMAGAVLADVLVLHALPTASAPLVAALAGVAYAHRTALAGVAAFLERNL